MKMINIEVTEDTFLIPVADYLATANAISKEETRFYLQGVFCEATDIGAKLTATNGHFLMHATVYGVAFIGSNCRDSSGGFILDMDSTDKAFKAKCPTGGKAWIYGDVSTGIAQIVSLDSDVHLPDSPCPRIGVLEFAFIDGTFPDYRRVLPDSEGEGVPVTSFDLAFMTPFLKACAVYKRDLDTGTGVRFTSHGAGNPFVVEIEHVQHFKGVVMPRRFEGE